MKLGYISVDAGIVMIGDPCYSVTGDASHHIKTWSEFCDKTVDEVHHPETGQIGMAEPWGSRLGLVVPTYWGDGTYPVYAGLKNGRIASISVDFYEDDFEDDE